MVGLPYGEKKLWPYVKPFSSDTGTLRTDERTDKQTDRRTDLLYQYGASVYWRAIKIFGSTVVRVNVAVPKSSRCLSQQPAENGRSLLQGPGGRLLWISGANFCIAFNYWSVLLSFRDTTTERTTDGRRWQSSDLALQAGQYLNPVSSTNSTFFQRRGIFQTVWNPKSMVDSIKVLCPLFDEIEILILD